MKHICTCPSGDGSLTWPCPTHSPEPSPMALVPVETLQAWKSMVNTLAVLSVKRERTSTAIALKTLIQGEIDDAAPARPGANFADGESPCVLEWGAVSLPVGDPSRVTEMKLLPTLWAAIAEGALCGFDWRVYPLALTPASSAPAPAAVPLTMERAWDAVKEADIDWHTGWAGDPLEVNRYLQLIRIVERAHGIGA